MRPAGIRRQAKGCTVKDCILPHAALGLCEVHYQRRWMTLKLIRKFGLTDAEEHLQRAFGPCEICGQDEPLERLEGRLSLDHDHITGEFRGWLCSLCNTGLGKFRDNPTYLEWAARYLKGERTGP